jgi:hypothetical protein
VLEHHFLDDVFVHIALPVERSKRVVDITNTLEAQAIDQI